MAMTAHQKGAALLRMKQEATQKALVAAGLRNELGAAMTDFQPRGHDAQDFGSVSRFTLQRMLQDAYDAGFDHGQRYG